MNSNNKEIGVITEQGYAAGFGLGYNPVSKEDQKKMDNKKDQKDDPKKSKK